MVRGGPPTSLCFCEDLQQELIKKMLPWDMIFFVLGVGRFVCVGRDAMWEFGDGFGVWGSLGLINPPSPAFVDCVLKENQFMFNHFNKFNK